MMLKCPLRETEERQWMEMERKERERRGEVVWYTKAEVGVVFPVNTELQCVIGERFSGG